MTIRVNGEPLEIAGPMTLTALLAELKIDPRRVAVEHNLTVVKRAHYDSVVVGENDAIEIVSFIGGGAGTRAGEVKIARVARSSPFAISSISNQFWRL